MKKCLDCGADKSRKGNYCKPCGYMHRKRPSGLTYSLKVINVGWFKEGHRLSVGRIPSLETRKKWSMNRAGKRVSIVTEFKKSENLGRDNHKWKGDKVGYYALHSWVYRHKGKPKNCEQCGVSSNLQWANKSHMYKRDKEDWLSLCVKCHRKYDQDTWGLTTKKFNL